MSENEPGELEHKLGYNAKVDHIEVHEAFVVLFRVGEMF